MDHKTINAAIAPLALAALLAAIGPATAEATCAAAMPDFQSAMKSDTADALTAYLDTHAPCFEAPARARRDALMEAQADNTEAAEDDAGIAAALEAEMVEAKPIDLEAGPLWNHDHAKQICPQLCTGEGRTWTGNWHTTRPNEMSVCNCE